MMRAILPAMLLLFALAGCADKPDDFVTPSWKCVQKIVPVGSKVSAAVARSAVAACQKPILQWTNGSMRNACRGDCDFTGARNVTEFGDRKEHIEEMLLLNMSDEIEPSVVRL